MLELAIRAVQRVAQAVDLLPWAAEGRAQVLELGGRCREPLVASQPLVAFRERLAQVAKLLLPIRELAVALLHLALLLVELAPCFGRGLLALRELAPKLLEVALVGRQQLTLLVDRRARARAARSRAPLSRPRCRADPAPGGCAALRCRASAPRSALRSERRHRGRRSSRWRRSLRRCSTSAESSTMRCSRSTSVARARSLAALLTAVRSLVAVASRARARWSAARGPRSSCSAAHEVGLRGGAHVVRFGQRALEAGDLAAQRLDFGLGFERRRGLAAQLVQLEPQLGEPAVALLELAAELVVDIGLGLSACGRGRTAPGRPRPGASRSAASRSLSSRRSVVRRSWYSLICASIVSDFCAPEIDFFLGELLGTGLGDLELLLELRHLGALGFGDLLEMPGLLLPAQALGFDALEPMGQDVELLLETVFGARLRFSCSSSSEARASDSLSAFCKRAKAFSANSRGLAIARPKLNRIAREGTPLALEQPGIQSRFDINSHGILRHPRVGTSVCAIRQHYRRPFARGRPQPSPRSSPPAS